jgi:hypothetical protein
MPDPWDPVVYRERAKAWREKAEILPETDPNREPCLVIAGGYETLAAQLEMRCKPAQRCSPQKR